MFNMPGAGAVTIPADGGALWTATAMKQMDFWVTTTTPETSASTQLATLARLSAPSPRHPSLNAGATGPPLAATRARSAATSSGIAFARTLETRVFTQASRRPGPPYLKTPNT